MCDHFPQAIISKLTSLSFLDQDTIVPSFQVLKTLLTEYGLSAGFDTVHNKQELVSGQPTPGHKMARASQAFLEDTGVVVSEIIRNTDAGVIKFPSSHEEDGKLKTMYVVSNDDVQLGAKEKKNYVARIPRRPVPVDNCPLFRKFGSRNFMIVHFEHDVRLCVMMKILLDFKHIQTKPNQTHFTSPRCIKVKVGHRQEDSYKFFGHSPSQLRGKKYKSCVMYNTILEGEGSYETLISEFGDFNKISNVSKRAARIGLLLSTAEPCIHLKDEEIEIIRDIESDRYNFTDGCGYVSKKVASEMMQKMKEMGKLQASLYEAHPHNVPSVFQVKLC